MKIFISWSGETSRKLAIELRDWIPSVIQSIVPYVSSEDIDKGTRWSTDISKELSDSNYGILCVTKDNLNASWLNFEAGALSKTFDKSKVAPFLLGVKRSDVQGPIVQFQSTIFEKSDVYKLLQSINSSLELNSITEERLKKSFEVWWPDLESKLKLIENGIQAIKPGTSQTPKPVNRNSDQILEEILTLVRNQQRILSNPELLLPPQYLLDLYDDSTNSSTHKIFNHKSWTDLFESQNKLLELIENGDLRPLNKMNEFESALSTLKMANEYISSRYLNRFGTTNKRPRF